MNATVVIDSPNVKYSDDAITANYVYNMNHTSYDAATNTLKVKPASHPYTFQTKRKVCLC